jgi:hypothetical protein
LHKRDSDVRGIELTAADLADRLRNRLAELDTERVRVAGALASLEHPVPRARAKKVSLVDAIRASPGARRSMLALICGAPAASVAVELDELADAGVVERDGLGWRLCEAAAANG